MAQTLSSDIYVIIPAYNEANYLPTVLSKVANYTRQIIVVDDGSSDATNQVASAAKYVVTHRLNLGKGAALKTGCELAFNQLNARAVILMDADDQHNPQELESFQLALNQNYELVLGVRDLDVKMPWSKRQGNVMASQLVKVLFGAYIPDIPSGYKALTKKAYQQLDWTATDYGVELEIAVKTVKHQLRFCTVPIQTIYHDLSKGMTVLDTIAMLQQLVRLKLSL